MGVSDRGDLVIAPGVFEEDPRSDDVVASVPSASFRSISASVLPVLEAAVRRSFGATDAESSGGVRASASGRRLWTGNQEDLVAVGAEGEAVRAPANQAARVAIHTWNFQASIRSKSIDIKYLDRPC